MTSSPAARPNGTAAPTAPVSMPVASSVLGRTARRGGPPPADGAPLRAPGLPQVQPEVTQRVAAAGYVRAVRPVWRSLPGRRSPRASGPPQPSSAPLSVPRSHPSPAPPADQPVARTNRCSAPSPFPVPGVLGQQAFGGRGKGARRLTSCQHERQSPGRTAAPRDKRTPPGATWLGETGSSNPRSSSCRFPSQRPSSSMAAAATCDLVFSQCMNIQVAVQRSSPALRPHHDHYRPYYHEPCTVVIVNSALPFISERSASADSMRPRLL